MGVLLLGEGGRSGQVVEGLKLWGCSCGRWGRAGAWELEGGGRGQGDWAVVKAQAMLSNPASIIYCYSLAETRFIN